MEKRGEADNGTQAAGGLSNEEWDATQALAEGAPARGLIGGALSKAEMVGAARAYVSEAKELGVPPERWFANYRDGDILGGIMWEIASGGRSGRWAAFEELSAAGGTPWTDRIQEPMLHRDKDGRLMAVRSERVDHLPHAMADAIFKMSGSEAPKALLRGALRGLGPEVEGFIGSLAKAYERKVSHSSKTAKGILGAADKEAKRACEIVVACQSEIATAASDPKGAARAAALVTDAKERLAAKMDQVGAAADPAALRKSLSTERKTRIATLGMVVATGPRDEEMIMAAFRATPWLREEPLASSIAVAGKSTLVGRALEAGSILALRELEAIGANLWLAGIQEGQHDPCLWALGAMAATLQKGDDVGVVARMLLKGAAVEGVPEPRRHCWEMMEAAGAKLAPSRRQKMIFSLIASFRSEFERQEIDVAVKPSPGQDALEGAPKRGRRASL